MERLTELEVINRMLLDIRLAPLPTIDDTDTYSEGMIARGILRELSLETLVPGWNFNTRRLTLSPEVDGRIPVPPGTIDIFVPQFADTVIIDSDNYVMLASDGTKVFTGSLDAFVVMGYTWGQLPATLQCLCMHRARLAFVLGMKSEGGTAASAIAGDIQRAEASAKAWDMRQCRRSMLDTLKMRTHVSQNTPRW